MRDGRKAVLAPFRRMLCRHTERGRAKGRGEKRTRSSSVEISKRYIPGSDLWVYRGGH